MKSSTLEDQKRQAENYIIFIGGTSLFFETLLFIITSSLYDPLLTFMTFLSIIGTIGFGAVAFGRIERSYESKKDYLQTKEKLDAVIQQTKMPEPETGATEQSASTSEGLLENRLSVIEKELKHLKERIQQIEEKLA